MSATAKNAFGTALRAATPRQFWRSLDELAGTAEFQSFLHDEFPRLAERWTTSVDRRSALKLLGASLMMGGLAACSRAEFIEPYVQQPEDFVQGQPRYYATTLNIEGYGFGVIATTHEGRPTKLDGNPDHPATLGASDPIIQASVLGLYDPDRAQSPTFASEVSSLAAFHAAIAEQRERWTENGGKGLAIVLGAQSSPSLLSQMEKLQRLFPLIRWYRNDLGEGEAEAAQSYSGEALKPVYRLDRAQTILSLDADFLGEGEGKLNHAAGYSLSRRVRAGQDGMNRLFAAASTPTITSASADHRLMISAHDVEDFTRALHARLSADEGGNGRFAPFIDAVAEDLRRAGSKALVIPGPRQGAAVHIMVHDINQLLGAVGTSLDFIAAPDKWPVPSAGLYELAQDAEAGELETLFILGDDLVHAVPGDIDAESLLAAIGTKVYLGLHRDATARLCDWHIPQSHDLESWGDIRAFDGTASLIQPMIEPLYESLTPLGVLAALGGDYDISDRQRVRTFWQERGLGNTSFAAALQAGIIPDSAAAPTDARLVSFPLLPARQPSSGTVEIQLKPDVYLRDGRYAPNVWLQELPRPLSKTVWGNAARIAPALAERLGIETGDMVSIKAPDRGELRIPAWIEPGQPPDSVALDLGFGRNYEGENTGVGVNVAFLRRRSEPWIIPGASIARTDERGHILTTQHHHAMEGRDIVRTAAFSDFAADADISNADTEPPPHVSMYPEWDYKGEAWGMVIDLSACIGCMACVAGCQAENNTPTVGPDEVAAGHEMHWLRVDRYYEGDPDDPDVHFQPVPCMHCEQAPCEVVCPVNATVHTEDGLNAQVYNRCIGTRYCSQNCPYKVRRFNFLQYQDFSEQAPLRELMNPEVSVRSRGVMEKCTYCVQRVNAARIESGVEDRPIPDGLVRTACQQACPTQAITFGNINDPTSIVAKAKREPHNYQLLAELNTRPRTSYLAEIRNPRHGEDANG